MTPTQGQHTLRELAVFSSTGWQLRPQCHDSCPEPAHTLCSQLTSHVFCELNTVAALMSAVTWLCVLVQMTTLFAVPLLHCADSGMDCMTPLQRQANLFAQTFGVLLPACSPQSL